ncbi:MAG TPA: endonuclease/exonuclease/phosphatase family protein [Bacillota bacterium]
MDLPLGTNLRLPAPPAARSAVPPAGRHRPVRLTRAIFGSLGTAILVVALVVSHWSYLDARPVAGALVAEAADAGPALTPARPLKVMTFNIRHAQGDDGRVSVERIAEILRASDADVVGLQEVDRRMPRSGWQDQVRQIAARLGYDYAFGRNLGIGPVGFGNAVLSRYPIITRQNLSLPGELEPRGALVITINLDRNHLITFADTHLGLSATDRQGGQVAAIVDDLQKLSGPVILVGDFNDTAGAPEQAQLSGLLKDSYGAAEKRDGEGTFGVAAGRAGERIDFVWLSGDLKPLTWSTVPATASDHLPVVVEVVPAGT